MRTRFTIFSIMFLIVAGISGVLDSPAGGTSTKKRPPRFAPPTNGRLGYVNTVEYFLISDPRLAAKTLLAEAAQAGVDVDQRGEPSSRNEIEVASGTIEPSDANRLFAVSSSAEGDTICLIKLRHRPSIRELADIMSLGVHLYKGIPYLTYIARVPLSSLPDLQDNAMVDWVGVYLPTHKVPPREDFPANQTVSVDLLTSEQGQFRKDIATLGGTVLSYHESIANGYAGYTFTVKIDPSQVPQIVRFWWVERVTPNAEFHIRASTAVQPSVATFTGHYRPYDSRRLVSDTSEGLYEGRGAEVLVYDDGCYHQHQALDSRVLLADSDPSTDSFHGTHVSGIILGEYARYVTGGGIAGVGTLTRFVQRAFATPLVTALETPGTTIANHSYAQGTGGEFRYTAISALLDEFAHDSHDVLSINVSGYVPTQIEAPGTAKNVLTVGSIYYVTADTTWQVLGMLADNSGTGPTQDYRLKPELVAPGGSEYFGVVSCQAPTLPTGAYTWDSAYDGYATYFGTSMSAPHVTGTAAVLLESYNRYITDYGLASDPNYAPTSQLYRAMLVNTAIPLRWNGDSVAIFQGALATSETLRGFANCEYGYGVVNAHSGILSSDDEYRRVLIWQDDVAVGPTAAEAAFLVSSSPFYPAGTPRYLVATMAYDDVPAAALASSPLLDHLEFSLVEPDGVTRHDFTAGSGFDHTTVQKIIVPWPTIASGGVWKAQVSFPYTSDTRALPQQSFAVVVDVMEEVPSLRIDVGKTYKVKKGTSISIPVTITNIGGNVAAGITVRLDDPTHHTGIGSSIDSTFYVGNLLAGNKSVKKVFKIVAPGSIQDIPLALKVDLINKMADGGPYPFRKTITVKVVDKVKISGNISMFPEDSEDVEDAEIFVNGASSGERTHADGSYSVEVDRGVAVTVKPRKGTTVFLPADTTFAGPLVDKERSFKARYHKVTGVIRDENGAPVDSIVVVPVTANKKFRGRHGLTDSNGHFEAYVEHGWTGHFKPKATDEFMNYTPETLSHAYFDSVVTNIGDLNFRTRRVAFWGGGGMKLSSAPTRSVPTACVSDGSGGALVFWSQDGVEDGYLDLFGQRIGADGMKVWSAGQEDICTAPMDQKNARVVALNDGTFLVAWMDKRAGDWDIYAQRLSASGQPLWSSNGVAVCQAGGDQQTLGVVGIADFAVMVWADRRSGNSDIYAQRVNSNGSFAWTPNGRAVCTVAGDQLSPAMDVKPDRSVYVAWQDKRPGVTGSDTYMQRLAADGTELWAPDGILVAGNSSSSEEVNQSVSVSNDGSCFVAYEVDPHATVLGYIDATGSGLWNSWKSIPATAKIAADPHGGIFVAGVAILNLAPLAECGMYGFTRPVGLVRHYDALGFNDWGMDNATGGTTRIAGVTLAAMPDGGAIIVWNAFEGCGPDRDILAQRYLNGSSLWGQGFGVAVSEGDQASPVMAHDLSLGAIVCWNSWRDVYASRINDAPLTYTVSGIVRDATGAAVPGVEIEATDGIAVLATKKSSDSGYVLSVPAHWKGTVRARPRGYLNLASPMAVDIGPALANAEADFALTHETTRWQKQGLLIRELATPTFATATMSMGSTAAGTMLAWNDDKDAYVQLLSPTGDVQWTRGGDALLSTPWASKGGSQIVPRGDSKFIVFWNGDGSVGAQLVDQAMDHLWGENGVAIGGGDAALAACSDAADGAFLLWHDTATQEVRLQHIGANGATWAQPLKLGVATLVNSARVQPDGSGGVIAVWHVQAATESRLYAQRTDSSGITHWGGANSWEPLNVRPSNPLQGPFIGPAPADFRMLVNKYFGSTCVAWSERPQAESFDARIRLRLISPDGDFPPGWEPEGQELNSLPGSQYISDMAGTFEDEDAFFLLYDELNGSATGRLALQKVTFWGGYGSPEQGRTMAPPGPRFVGRSRLILNDVTRGGTVFWEEEPNNIFACAVDSLCNDIWATRNYSVTENGAGMSVGSDGQNGAIVTWYGTDGGLYATRVNESVAIRGDVNVSTFVRRKFNGVVEPVNTARFVGCPKGEVDDLIFRIEMSGQVMTPPPPDAFTLDWPPTTGSFAFRSFRAATADSAMRLDGDRFRTTITLRELSGSGDDSVTVLANGYPVAKAPYHVISADNFTSGASEGDVGLADLAELMTHYPTGSNPSPPYSDRVDYFGLPVQSTTRPDSLIGLADFVWWQPHYNHKKPAELYAAGSRVATSGGQVVLGFSETQVAGQRRLRVAVRLADVEPFSVGYFALQNHNPIFEFAEWTQSPSYPYGTISAPTIRDGEKLVGIAAFAPKNAVAWNGEIGTIDMIVSSTAPIELTEDDFALVTGDILAVGGDVLSVSMRDGRTSPKYGNSLSQNYPNPFNPTTTISYSIAQSGHVDLTVFDVTGAVVRRLVNGDRKPNAYHVVWDGTDSKGTAVASGIYFYRLRAPQFTMSKKMLLLK